MWQRYSFETSSRRPVAPRQGCKSPLHPGEGLAVLFFLQLYLAHLVADFVLQPDWIARRKTAIRPLAAHAGVHLVCAIAAVNLGLDRRVSPADVIVAPPPTLPPLLEVPLSRGRRLPL